MKAYVDVPAGLSRAMGRVAGALRSYSTIDIVEEEHEADIVVLHVIGYPETVAAIQSIKARDKKYAMIQYCLRSTQEPDTHKWVPLWNDEACVCVWSYYDLLALVREDCKTEEEGTELIASFLERFYHAPMGVNSGVFRKQNRPKRYEIMTSGYVTESEAILECQAAAAAVGGRMFHLGPGLPGFDTNVTTQEEGIADGYLVDLMNSCKYVAGLRRCEGFEMPALEGLCCGARPVCFDRPHYRYWFGDSAVYVPEGSSEEVAKALEAVFRSDYRPVTADERQAILARFDWRVVAKGFWQLVAPVKVQLEQRRPRLLWVGDAVVSSGFARATHKILDVLVKDWDIAVLGINHFGDPHSYPYKIWPALAPLAEQSDLFGTTRIAEVAAEHHPDVIVIQQDPWNIPAYMKTLSNAHINVPVVGFIAVDGKNCQGLALKDLSLAVFWTHFGEKEARLGGYTGPSAIVPLGVDTSIYTVVPKAQARAVMELPGRLARSFIVGNVNRNQPRKRLDLTVRYFCNWMRRENIPDAMLFLHVAPTGDRGWDVQQLMKYYGGEGRLILASPHIGKGVPESILAATYGCFDVQVNTAAGEGWGLTTLEGMACGVPQIVPDWAALGEWPGDGVSKIPCTSVSHTDNNINAVGGVPDEELFIKELHKLYTDKSYYDAMASKAYRRAMEPMFNWTNIGTQFNEVLTKHLAYITEATVA